jgi:hypothetical protein
LLAIHVQVVANLISASIFVKEEFNNGLEYLLSKLWSEPIQDTVFGNQILVLDIGGKIVVAAFVLSEDPVAESFMVESSDMIVESEEIRADGI